MFDPIAFEHAAAALPQAFFAEPPVCGLILGSGWSDAFTPDSPPLRIPYSAIPHLGASTVAGHAGELLLMTLHGRRVVAFAGRRHWYEGTGWLPAVLPVELLRRMGTTTLLLTNAAGGISPAMTPGDLMVITDHLNLTGLNPLQGPPVAGWGPRFPDQTHLYDPALADLLHAAADAPHRGVYAFSAGPSYETPAEIRAYARLGADAIGMSTVPEATVANAAGMRVAALSCITNMAAGIDGPRLTHDEVLQKSREARPRMAAAVERFIATLP